MSSIVFLTKKGGGQQHHIIRLHPKSPAVRAVTKVLARRIAREMKAIVRKYKPAVLKAKAKAKAQAKARRKRG